MFFTDSAAVTRAFMSRKNGWRRERERGGGGKIKFANLLSRWFPPLPSLFRINVQRPREPMKGILCPDLQFERGIVQS